jgi:hypothetical protein
VYISVKCQQKPLDSGTCSFTLFSLLSILLSCCFVLFPLSFDMLSNTLYPQDDTFHHRNVCEGTILNVEERTRILLPQVKPLPLEPTQAHETRLLTSRMNLHSGEVKVHLYLHLKHRLKECLSPSCTGDQINELIGFYKWDTKYRWIYGELAGFGIWHQAANRLVAWHHMIDPLQGTPLCGPPSTNRQWCTPCICLYSSCWCSSVFITGHPSPQGRGATTQYKLINQKKSFFKIQLWLVCFIATSGNSLLNCRFLWEDSQRFRTCILLCVI